jgi:phosphatidylserine decarboxylase
MQSSTVRRVVDISWHVIMTFFFIFYSIPAKIIGHIEREMELITLPKAFGIRKLLLKGYVWWNGCRMEEAAVEDLNEYRCMRDVFVRELKPNLRKIDETAAIVSPCDNCRPISHGYLTKVPEKQGLPEERDVARDAEETEERGDGVVLEEYFPDPSNKMAMEMGGKQKTNNLVKVKGVPYRFEEALGVCPITPDAGKKLEFLACHLGPSELHHFSNPYNSFELHYRIRIPGHVLPLLPERARRWPYMFWSNERVVLLGTYLNGGERCFCAISFLAATAFVAHIKLDFDAELKMNQMWDAITLSVPYLTGWRPPFVQARRTSRPYGLKRGPNCSVPIAGEPGSAPTKGLHVRQYDPPLHFESGQRLGHFASGSGVLMVWEAPEAFRLRKDAMTIGIAHPLGSPLTDCQALTPPQAAESGSSSGASSPSRSRRSSVQSSSGGTTGRTGRTGRSGSSGGGK